MINPAIVEGQIRGGVAQGVGAVLYEKTTYGEDGQPRSGTFMDYLIPTTMEIPEIEIHHIETPTDIAYNYPRRRRRRGMIRRTGGDHQCGGGCPRPTSASGSPNSTSADQDPRARRRHPERTDRWTASAGASGPVGEETRLATDVRTSEELAVAVAEWHPSGQDR